SRRVVEPVCERLGFGRLNYLVTTFLLPECLIALKIGSLLCGEWRRPGSGVRSNFQIAQVDAKHWLGILQGHKGGNTGSQISALSSIALVTQATHEVVP